MRRPKRILAGQGAAPFRLRLAAHPPPLAGEAFGGLPFERLPCKGLRSRAPPAAEKARRSRCSGRRMQARFSVRRMMRGPQTGNGGQSRLRGALPACGGDIPQSPAATLPATTSAGICQARRPAGVLPKCPYRPAKSDLSSPDFGRRHSNLTKIITLGRAFDAKWKFPPECRKTA